MECFFLGWGPDLRAASQGDGMSGGWDAEQDGGEASLAVTPTRPELGSYAQSQMHSQQGSCALPPCPTEAVLSVSPGSPPHTHKETVGTWP